MTNEKNLTLDEVNTVEELHYLLRNGANVNERNDFEETPLLAALRRNVNAELIMEFLKSGAELNIKDNWGVSPLYCAVARYGKNLNLIKHFLDLGADIESGKRPNDRLLDHFVNHNQSCIKLIIKYKFLKNAHLLGSSSSDLEVQDYYHKYKAVVDLDLKPSCYVSLSQYLDCCASEIILMQISYIGNNFSLLNFATASFTEIHSNSRTEIMIENVVHELSHESYCIFRDIILSKIGRDYFLRKIVELLKRQNAMGEDFPYQIVLNCLTPYFDDEVLLSIVNALKLS